MTDWNYNPTMKKLSNLYGIGANTPEGKEIDELLEGMTVSGNGKIDALSLAMYSYMLGICRGKRLERERRAKKTASGQEVAV